MRQLVLYSLYGTTILLGILIFCWFSFFLKGKRFALRDRLRQADAIVVLAGTRGNIKFLDGKIATGVHLYLQGFAPRLICSGKFSVKVTDNPTLIPLPELQAAAVKGRLQEKDIAQAVQTWDSALGALYMRDQAIQMGVPPSAILVEKESLHTRENAEMVLQLARQHGLKRLILVTSPFHQLRTYLTFAKVFQPYSIEILNYYAETGEWHPFTWFLSAEHRRLVQSEKERIKKYRQKGDLL
ncbi:MAG: YdcF family protein [Ktedonobacteraceae bacterium]|nr:YdcF family protein [Ktedonobacteraceae bacterium]